MFVSLDRGVSVASNGPDSPGHDERSRPMMNDKTRAVSFRMVAAGDGKTVCRDTLPVTCPDSSWRLIPEILAEYVTGDDSLSWLFEVTDVDGQCWTCAGTGHRTDTFTVCDGPGTCTVDGLVRGPVYGHDGAKACAWHACYTCGGTGAGRVSS